MSIHSPDFDHESFLVCTGLTFGGRGFEIFVRHDGFSYWFDPFALKGVLASDPNFGLRSFFHSGKDRKYMEQIYAEWTVKAKVPEDDLIVIRDEISPRFWIEDWDRDCDDRLDAMLEPIFWSSVNPQLSVPIIR